MRRFSFFLKTSKFVLAVLGLLFLPGGGRADDSQRLIVHEWGTFTALQNENGEPLMGINIDTEPVPRFVHNLSPYLLNSPVLSTQHWIHRQKAVPRHHPLVNLRMETPVIYFYPPANMKLPHTVNVDVKFRGGWITEFYPHADVLYPALQGGKFNFNDLSPSKVGNVAWRNLQIGTQESGPDTQDHVWLAPRKVAAANLTNEIGEHEKYLFYRGVAQQRSPLQVRTTNEGESLELHGDFVQVLQPGQQAAIQNLWLMETRLDGRSAYRRLEAVKAVHNGQQHKPVVVARRFSEADFSDDNRTRLEAEMYEALLREGLFADEAQALLSTWQQAYFVSSGLRVFYTVPREWTDHILPLTISGDPKITRVMIGRAELISDWQKEIIAKLDKTPASRGDWLAKVPAESPALAKLLAGRSDFGDLGVPIPSDFQMYLDLGRFRNALIAAEEERRGSLNLAEFIRENRLEPFRLSQGSGK